MMVVNDLAQVLFDALSNKKTKDRLDPQLTKHAKAYAAGVITAIKVGITAQPKVDGSTKPGSQLESGNSDNGTITNVMSDLMTAKITATFNQSNSGAIAQENKAVCDYIMATGKVKFESGTIKGKCVSDSNLLQGNGKLGRITRLNGSALANIVRSTFTSYFPKIPQETDMIRFYTALCDYIMANAEVEYAPGMVIGYCPKNPGALQGGSASNGTIK